ncbi:TRAP transporter large permease subunit, partial [Salmonella enterica subsp. enterica serovar Virginia]|nr:TRAP transporter large permease subunit [Salmonella enterica subsp. enterica serovar Virginia]
TITPPVGSGLYVGASVGKVKVEEVIKPLLPFYGAIIGVLLLIDAAQLSKKFRFAG